MADQGDDIKWELSNASEESSEEGSVLGFLQVCIERRFHRAIQQVFQDEENLSETEYWLHADVGGSPMMEENRGASNYCYNTMGVRLMGWAAHGAICGGYPPGTPDDKIQGDLIVTMRKKAYEYPKAKHYAFFATIRDGRTVVNWSRMGPVEPE